MSELASDNQYSGRPEPARGCRLGELASYSAPAEVEPPAPTPQKRSHRWRELSGAVAYGLCALAAVVLAFQIVAWLRATPGPGAVSVVGHLLAGGLAVVAQWFADRRSGWPGVVATVGVFVIGAVTLWLFWWA